MVRKEKERHLSEFFRTEHKKMKGFVRRLINDTADRESEDIIQDVMLHLFDKADFTVPIENLAAYVYRSLRNRVVDIFRKKKEKKLSLDRQLEGESKSSISDFLTDERFNVHNEVEKRQLLADIDGALEQLTTREQKVILETVIRGRTSRELAESWDVPLGTVLALKARTLEKLRKMLDKQQGVDNGTQ